MRWRGRLGATGGAGLLVLSCGGEGGGGQAADAGGEGGSAGSAATGGTAGSAATGGTAGSAATGGTAGSAATGGTAGAAGSGGAAGCVDDPGATPPTVTIAPVTGLHLPTTRATLAATVTPGAGEIRSVVWEQISGAPARLLHPTRSTAYAAELTAGNYSFSVAVSDAHCREARATVAFTLAPEPPLPATPLGQLRHLATPVFREGHTLPPLSYASCLFSLPAQVELETELVERFGYAYSLHRATPYWNGLIDNPSSDMYTKVRRHLAEPRRYPLFTTVMRPHWEWEDGRSVPLLQYLQQDLPARCPGCSPGLLTSALEFSPAADPRYYDLIGDDTAAPLRLYRERGIHLSVVLNLGEIGVGLSAGSCFNGAWSNDAAIAADVRAFLGVSTVPPCNTEGWARYASNRYARTQQRITDKVRAELPPDSLYLYYRTEGNLNRERYGIWYDYAPWYEDTKANSTHPNMSAYYAGDEPPYLYWDTSGWDPNTDMLTGTLASVAFQIREGSPLSYNWVSGGWPTASRPDVSPYDRYLGYLKALYLAGNLGAVAAWWSPGLWRTAGGSWSCDPNATLADEGRVTDGLAQMVALGEAHALYSHFERFLRQGSLVPGPALHRFTRNLPAARQVPAYELNCSGTPLTCHRTHRVLARQLDGADEWLVVAWATAGPDAAVSVTLPGYGPLEVTARAAGSLYHVVKRGAVGEVTLIDVDPLHPTALLAP